MSWILFQALRAWLTFISVPPGRKTLSRKSIAAGLQDMKLLVLGATGGTGLEIVRQALARGHTITAFVRRPDALGKFGNEITVVRGSLLESDELGRVLIGHDAVLSAFGPRLPISKGDTDLLQRFAIALTNGMRQVGARRVVIESTAFLFKDAVLPPAHLFGRLFFPTVVRDAGAMETTFQQSDLEWTLVRPPQLTNKAHTGKYRVKIGHLPPFGFNISRADVADYMIKAGENHASVGKVVGVAN